MKTCFKTISCYGGAIFLLCLVLFFTASCTSYETESDEKLVEESQRAEDESIFHHGDQKIQKESIDKETVELTEPPPGSEEKFEQFVPTIEKREQKEEAKRQPPFYEELIKGKADKKIKVNLILDASALEDVVPMFAEELGFSYIIDPKVKGAVTLKIENPNSKDNKFEMTNLETWQLFEQILWMAGAYCTMEGRILHIRPFLKMPQERKILTKTGERANVKVRIIKVRNVAAKKIISTIKPFLTEGARATEMSGENAILLVEAPENIPKIEGLLELLDQKQRATWPKTAIRCVNVSAAHIKEELASILPVLGFTVTTDKTVADPGSIHVTSLERLQVIVASAANQEALDEMKKWIRILDRSDIGDQEQIFVYKVINSTSEELLQAISTIFNIEGTAMKASVGGSQAAGNTGGAARTTTSTTSVSSRGTRRGKGPATVFEIPAKIFADGKHNRLIIRTTPRAYAMIKALLGRLDTVPSQVLLQVLIAEIRLNESTEFGLEYSGKFRDTPGYSSTLGVNYPGTASSSLNPQNPSGPEGGFKWFVQNKDDPDKFAYLRALAGSGNFKILSSPQIAAVSGTQASLDVGQEIPTVTKTVSDPNNAALSTSNEVEYRKTGILLKITPQVTKGGLITMDINQEVSAQGDDVLAGNATYPSFIERKIITSLSMRDGSTLIIGGIIQEEKQDTNQSVPFVSKIPMLSKLLGFNEMSKRRTELLFMITASVISEKTDLQKLVDRYKESVKALREFEENNAQRE